MEICWRAEHQLRGAGRSQSRVSCSAAPTRWLPSYVMEISESFMRVGENDA